MYHIWDRLWTFFWRAQDLVVAGFAIKLGSDPIRRNSSYENDSYFDPRPPPFHKPSTRGDDCISLLPDGAPSRWGARVKRLCQFWRESGLGVIEMSKSNVHLDFGALLGWQSTRRIGGTGRAPHKTVVRQIESQVCSCACPGWKNPPRATQKSGPAATIIQNKLGPR